MSMRNSFLFTATLSTLCASGIAHAADTPAQAAARKALTDLVPQASIDAIEAAPMAGFQQVIVGSQIVYVSNDGKYILQGKLLDTLKQRDLTEARLAIDVKKKLDAVPTSRRIIFAPAGKPQYKVTVFTDIDCGYCRKLHSQIAEYNKRGIEVDYLFYPRSGLSGESYDKAMAVWCAKDRKASFTAAKAGQTPPLLKCDNPIAQDFELGNQVGVPNLGTPTIFASDGSKLGGYLDPDQMLARLKALDTPTL
ncbi:DsbC family protein [Dokdonella sp.]|uniref:DsbC family protein n=1 Tax=Dokdonella sp. TaxID=2291710 RepID=UPI0025BAFB62|nr:DsbC family protein [Dokdonella sp.]MBX3688056.1 DsbC family protein [Dokdonella sp.]